jgi:uncharacterized protein (TIRG00374 family)
LNIRKLILAALGSVLLVAILYTLSVLYGGLDETAAEIGRLSGTTWAAVIALSLGNYLIRFLRWSRYLAEMAPGQRPPGLHHGLIYTAGFALTTTPGKSGEALRSIYLDRYGVSVSASIACLFVERLLDLVAIFLLALLCVFFFTDPDLLRMTLVAGGAALLLLLLLKNRHLLRRIGATARRLPFAPLLRQAGGHIGIMIDRANAILQQPTLLYTGLVAGLVAWGLEGVGLFLIVAELDLAMSVVASVGVYALAVLAGALSFLPGGIGGTEAVMGGLLIAAGAEPHTAVAATILCRLATLWLAVLLGLLCMGILAFMRIYPGVPGAAAR